jgi:1-acyl-sn-glycerol-3-phosphate acyltransferase
LYSVTQGEETGSHPPKARKPSGADIVGPVSGWRLRLYQLAWWVVVGIFGRLYFPGRVEGVENLPPDDVPFILAPVHRSYIDWIVVTRVTKRRMRFITKDEVWKVKAVGRFIEILGAFPVHRGTADREAFNRSEAILDGGEPLVLFPEGTRQHGPDVQPLLDGAAYLALRAKVPIVPVGIGGTESRMPKGSKFPRPGRVHIVVGAPILPANFVRTDQTSRSDQGNGGAQEAKRHTHRVSRSAARKLSAALHDEVQACFDAAQTRLGIATGDHSRSDASDAEGTGTAEQEGTKD